MKTYGGKGYKEFVVRGHPNARKDGRIRRSRLIAAAIIGRPLSEDNIIHHVNGDYSDDRNENLVICENNAYHRLLHVREKAYNATGNPQKRKCGYCGKWDLPVNMRRTTGKRMGHETYHHKTCSNKCRKERQQRANPRA